MKIIKKTVFILMALFLLLFLYIAVKGDFNPERMKVQTLILGGRIIAPEAAQILDRYTSGSGDTLFLDSGYFQKSPVVINAAKRLKVGEQVDRLAFKQKEDWRLSYALNGFTVSRSPEGYEIKQYIVFDKTKKVYTDLDLKFTKIRVKDNIAHCYPCNPFWAICRFTTLKE
jgi:hypothetical protein